MFNLTPKEYADRIRNSRQYKGGDIRIISCGAGAKENGAAKQLAEELGVRVCAPTETVNVDEEGRMFITDNMTLAEMWHETSDKSKYYIEQSIRFLYIIRKHFRQECI